MEIEERKQLRHKEFDIHGLEHKLHEGKLSFASEERMMRCLGLHPGSVCAFGLINDMNLLGNIFWFILGGFLTAVMYFVAGLLMCCTIIGIPFGVQLFKFGIFVLMPFGRAIN